MADMQISLDAYRNGTFDEDALEKALIDIKTSSYQYLSQAQRDIVDLQRFNLKGSQLKKRPISEKLPRKKPMQYMLTIDHPFIAAAKRHKFKNSSFLDKEITIADCANNPELFTFTFMVFVGGKFIDTVQLYCLESTTCVIFDEYTPTNKGGLPASFIQNMIKGDVDITVYFLANCAYGMYNTNINVLKKYSNELSLDRFNIVNNLTTEAKYITFVNDNNLLFSSVITDTVVSSGMLKFTNNDLNPYDQKLIHLNVFGFRNLYDIVTPVKSGSTQYFSLPKLDMPVPVENLMIFRRVNNVLEYAHDIEVTLYYPYHYVIENAKPTDNLSIYVFYFDDTIQGAGLEYKNDLETVYDYSSLSSFAEILKPTTPEGIKNYMPSERFYNIKDFQSNVIYPDALVYKINRLKEWIDDNPDVLRAYLARQYKAGKGYYIECENIDLAAKLRNNNYSEVRYENEKKDFSEPMYVFILGNDEANPFKYYRFFIDGIMYIPSESYFDGQYEYFYFPTSLINSKTIIEIEQFTSYNYEKEVTFSNIEEWKTISFPDRTTIDTDDVFLIDVSDRSYLDIDEYHIAVDEHGITVPLSTRSFKELKGEFKIRLTREAQSRVGKTLRLFIKQSFEMKTVDVVDEFSGYNALSFVSTTPKDLEYVRFFRNGRMIPNQYTYGSFDAKHGGINSISAGFVLEVGDVIIADQTPFRYNVVYDVKKLNPSGFIDLKGFITRPFDLKWYDVYLNGRKLNEHHVTIISPTKIYIKNVNSLKNFQIIEKERDDEYFGLGANPISPTDRFWDYIKEEADKQHPPISDIEPDIILGKITLDDLDLIHFFNGILRFIGFINPDILQLSTYDRDRFNFSKGKDPILLNPDGAPEAGFFLHINPDEVIVLDEE